MTTILASEFVTLDGVSEAPETWNAPYVNDEYEEYSHEVLFGAEALLLGRRTYQVFADAWPSRTGEFADRLNELPKHVVSSTLERLDWNNSRLLDGDLPKAVSQLKREVDGPIVVYGSGELVRGLLDHGLVDEVRIWIHPLVLGSGTRLFEDDCDTIDLELVESDAFDSGVTVLRYRPTDESR